MVPIVVLMVALIVSPTPAAAPRRSTPTTRGLYSPHVFVERAVVPRRIDSEGRFLSHSITHHHSSDLPRTHRSRREVPSPVHFALPLPWTRGNKEELMLELWPSTDFLGPSLLLQKPRYFNKRAGPANSCHFQGRVKGDPGSRVAVSTCHGLAGVIRSKRHGELWVEPARSAIQVTQDPEVKHPHIVYRRSAALPALKRRRKKKRSHEKNCGTREPRRVVQLLRGEGGAKRGLRRAGGGRRRSDRWPRAAVINSNSPGWLQNAQQLENSHEEADDEEEAAWWRSSLEELDAPEDTDGGLSGVSGGSFSDSIERHVEVLVVADQSMADFHFEQGGTDLETYLLTIMNMVAAFYKDPSIGNRINIIVVKMIFLDELTQGAEDLNITVNADSTLESFCAWQLAQNHPEDEHEIHHDVAILVTRVDICSRSPEPCGTLGVAHVAGMCHPRRSCSVNQDNGLAVAHTIAHELGHNFGMVHDAGPSSSDSCGSRDGGTLHVMTASFELDTHEMAWSSCSRRAITRFLDQGNGECLLDRPESPEELPFDLPHLPPGAMYDAERQCRLQFNASVTGVCSHGQDICLQLWCEVAGKCVTMMRPPADGTQCGRHKWCMRRECVEIQDTPEPVHGGWGEWGPWSSCSRTCGGGVASTRRHCDHPKPAHSGHFCVGRRKRYQVCNTQPCPEGSVSFRAQQCAEFEDSKHNKQDRERKDKWLPFFDKSMPCALFCTDAAQSLVVEAPYAAKDGSPCNASSRDMCIDGRCRRVGCDWRVESDAAEDACGVCRGDGSQCEIISSEFLQKEGTGYVEAALIPEGARNIRVQEMGSSKTFIAIASAATDHIYVDGKKWRPHWSGDCEVAGSQGTYDRWLDRETLVVYGPTNETLRVYVVFHGKHRTQQGLHYEYALRRKTIGESPPEFFWGFSEWSACSVTCGHGVQVARPVCKERFLGPVDAAQCQDEKASGRLVRACDMPPCPASWWAGPWQLCPVTCGGQGTLRRRSVLCVRPGEEAEALPDWQCHGEATTRPADAEPCPDLPTCPPGHDDEPVTPGLSLPLTTAGPPTRPPPAPRVMRRHRKREEVWSRGFHSSLQKQSSPSPSSSSADLLTHRTPRFLWVTTDWGECGRRCGGGSRRRAVTCHLATSGHRVSGRHCPRPRPTDHEPCNLRPCDDWIKAPWSDCSGVCPPIITPEQVSMESSMTQDDDDSSPPRGWQVRKVECPHPPHCEPAAKPPSLRPCANLDC